MKRFALMLMLAGTAYGQFTPHTNTGTFTTASSQWSDFSWTWSDYDDQMVSVTFNRYVSNAFLQLVYPERGRVYLTVTSDALTPSGTTTYFAILIPRTNIPPNNTYYAEFLGRDSSNATALTRSLAKGRISSQWSAFSVTNAASWTPVSITYTSPPALLAGYLTEAPIDGTTFGRKDGGWVAIAAGSASTTDATARAWAQAGSNLAVLARAEATNATLAATNADIKAAAALSFAVGVGVVATNALTNSAAALAAAATWTNNALSRNDGGALTNTLSGLQIRHDRTADGSPATVIVGTNAMYGLWLDWPSEPWASNYFVLNGDADGAAMLNDHLSMRNHRLLDVLSISRDDDRLLPDIDLSGVGVVRMRSSLNVDSNAAFVVEGTGDIYTDAASGTEIVNYRTATNLIATLGGGTGGGDLTGLSNAVAARVQYQDARGFTNSGGVVVGEIRGPFDSFNLGPGALSISGSAPNVSAFLGSGQSNLIRMLASEHGLGSRIEAIGSSNILCGYGVSDWGWVADCPITATKFYGDGSGLTNLPSAGGGDSSTWSTNPATQTVNMGGFGVTGLFSAVIGPGSYFYNTGGSVLTNQLNGSFVSGVSNWIFTTAAQGASIVGGASNSINGGNGGQFIGGGRNRSVTGNDAVSVGGHRGVSSGQYGGIFAGQSPTNSGVYSVAVGGDSLAVVANYAFGAGGYLCRASGQYSTVLTSDRANAAGIGSLAHGQRAYAGSKGGVTFAGMYTADGSGGAQWGGSAARSNIFLIRGDVGIGTTNPVASTDNLGSLTVEGVTRSGRTTNFMELTSTGLYAYGSATWWDDVIMPVTGAGGGSAAMAAWRSGIFALKFVGNSVDDAHWQLQIPHGVVPSGEVRVHMHISMDGTDADAAAGTIVWSVGRINAGFAPERTNTWSYTPVGTAYVHKIVSLFTITNEVLGSDLIIGTMRRDNNANDDGLFLHSMDAHIERWKLGSDDEYP